MRSRHGGHYFLTLFLSTALVFAALAPYWHGSHEDPGPTISASQIPCERDLHASPPAGAQGDLCAVCVAHRLLDSSLLFEVAPGEAAQGDDTLLLRSFDLPGSSLTAPSRGRSPPLC